MWAASMPPVLPDDLSQATSLQPIRCHSPQSQANQDQEKIV